jgi:putative spermidine/putrescine transport system permease protein
VAVAVVLGSAAAVALWRLQLRGITIGVILAPLLLPIAALAQGGHAQAQMLVLAGHASLGLAFGTGCSFARLAHVDRGVLRAAMCCGVSPLGTVRLVLLPLMAPGIWAGALLAALGSLGLSLATLIHGTPAPLTAMPVMPPAFWLTITGSGLLFCAVTTLALRLLRRA